MGGNTALELAAHYPSLPAAVVLIDSKILPAGEVWWNPRIRWRIFGINAALGGRA